MPFGNTAKTETKTGGNAPIAKIRVGGISVDVWENKGEKATFNTFSMQRSYKQGDEWKNTVSLRTQDLPKAILALQKAYEQAVTNSDAE